MSGEWCFHDRRRSDWQPPETVRNACKWALVTSTNRRIAEETLRPPEDPETCREFRPPTAAGDHRTRWTPGRGGRSPGDPPFDEPFLVARAQPTGSECSLSPFICEEPHVPDGATVVRGGTTPVPPAGEVFSGSAGSTLEDAAQGVPHGTIRSTTAGQIRKAGGTVRSAPELTRAGNMNAKHVNIYLGRGTCLFGRPQQNPVPKAGRIK